MLAGLGDILIDELSIGGYDLLNTPGLAHIAFNIYEDILDPLGPKADIRILDSIDFLGKNIVNGPYDMDVIMDFRDPIYENNARFKFKMLECSNLSDRTDMDGKGLASSGSGNGRTKQYDLRLVREELLNSQCNSCNKSYSDFTTNICKDVLKTNLLTNLDVEIQEQSASKRRVCFKQEPPAPVIRKLTNEHIGTESKSSCFVCFMQQKNGEQKYIISTYEKLFQQNSICTLYRRNNLDFVGANQTELANSIISIKIPKSFYAGNRALSATTSESYNLSTGTLYDQEYPKKQLFTILGKPIYVNPPSYTKKMPISVMYDKINDPQPYDACTAAKCKAQFLAQLGENFGQVKIHGNPKICLGDVVDLDIPEMSETIISNERQFSGKALVVSLKHNIGPSGQTPRYTMTLGLVKAGFEEIGGNNG